MLQDRTGVSPAEIARFDAMAEDWWNPNGPMRPLHAMNPLRTAWVQSRIAEHFKTPVTLLDVGCGAGLAAEALARRGHQVTGIDAAPQAIEAARAHAEPQSLPLEYRHATAEDLRAEGKNFQVITALEVIEHVPDPAIFLQTLAALLEPGGLLVVSTLNRTRRSYLTAKLGAEYLLRWLPIGTHDWQKFLTPPELATHLRQAGLGVTDIAGMVPSSLGWRISTSTAVNYIVAATK